jgi:hypothetical protein
LEWRNRTNAANVFFKLGDRGVSIPYTYNEIFVATAMPSRTAYYDPKTRLYRFIHHLTNRQVGLFPGYSPRVLKFASWGMYIPGSFINSLLARRAIYQSEIENFA